MISIQELLDIICTEAVEYGGLQEVPGQKHGAKQFYHSPKRGARSADECNGDRSDSDLPAMRYDLRLVRDADGKLHWKD